jgi:hypothetical protein
MRATVTSLLLLLPRHEHDRPCLLARNPHALLHTRFVFHFSSQIRLRVEHTGYKTLPVQRFGSAFLDQLANPSDILLLWRKPAARGKKAAGAPSLPADLRSVGVDADGRPPTSTIAVTDLISAEL